MSKYLSKVFKLDELKITVKDLIEDSIGSEGREEECFLFIDTLVNSGAGIYAGQELFELFGYETDAGTLEHEYYDEEITKFLDIINDELRELFEVKEGEKIQDWLKEFQENYFLYIDYLENDGSICLILEVNTD